MKREKNWESCVFVNFVMWWLLQLSEGKPNQTISQEKNKIIENKMLWKKIKLKFIDSKNVRPSFKKNTTTA